jgi:hypothetical protein
MVLHGGIETSRDKSEQDGSGRLLTCSLPVQRILQVGAKEGSEKRLRIGVDAGGCSGFQYVFELEDVNDDDCPIEEDDRFVLPLFSNNVSGSGITLISLQYCFFLQRF